MLTPSELLALLPGLEAARLGIPATGADSHAPSVALTQALVQSALADFELLTGERLTAVPPESEPNRREAFVSLLSAAGLRLRSQQVAYDAVRLHNPDVSGQGGPTLDLVRVVGRASRAEVQRARKLLNGSSWLRTLAGR